MRDFFSSRINDFQIWLEQEKQEQFSIGNKEVKKTSWAEIPSLEDLQIDWDYKPENPLGKRSSKRLLKKDLQEMFEVDHVPVKIVSNKFDRKSSLIDISTNGLAVLLDVKFKVGTLLRLGFFLGRQKIISKGIVRNSSGSEGDYRTGIEFLNLAEEHASFITCLNSSKIYRA